MLPGWGPSVPPAATCQITHMPDHEVMVFSSEKQAYPVNVTPSVFKPYGPEILNAVDLAQAIWRKSSRSAFNGNCVEVAELRGGDLIGVRDTKNEGNGPVLIFDGPAWRAFIQSLK